MKNAARKMFARRFFIRDWCPKIRSMWNGTSEMASLVAVQGYRFASEKAHWKFQTSNGDEMVEAMSWQLFFASRITFPWLQRHEIWKEIKFQSAVLKNLLFVLVGRCWTFQKIKINLLRWTRRCWHTVQIEVAHWAHFSDQTVLGSANVRR